MSSSTATTEAHTPSLPLALAGLALALLSPLFWALTLDNKFLQRTAAAMWIGMAGGVACAGVAAWRDSRKRTRGIAALVGVWVLCAGLGCAVLTGYLRWRSSET